jgi:small-conductance mechanosensitive channel/CRP-like cAMP-binding protein
VVFSEIRWRSGTTHERSCQNLNGPFRLLLPLCIAIVVVAAIFRATPGAPRRRLRRCVLLFAFYAVAIAAEQLFGVLGTPFSSTSATLGYAAQALEVLLIINLVAIALFDLLFHVVHWDYPDIVHELSVGAAYIVAAVWLMHRSGVNLSSIVATSAVVTAVIGLSLQATLGNVVGGLALQLDDSIHEGDWIELESKVQGRVRQIRWRHSVIETRDWDTLIVPNSQLLAQTIKVLGKRNGEKAPHRMWVYFSVDFRFAPGQVISIVNEALQAAPIFNVAAEPKAHCILYELGKENRDSYAYYAVRYWLTDLASDDPTSSLVRERIYAALRRAQMPLALPATTVFLSQDDPEHAERKLARERAFRSTALQNVDLFAQLSDEEKGKLAESVRLAPFSAGEVVTRQGSTAHWLYVLTKGKAEVRVAGAAGEEKKVAELEAPGFFGEMALMTGAPREATVVALTDVECLRVDKDDFKEILARRPEMAKEMSTILAQRRVELVAVRDNLDAEAKKRKMVTEGSKILASIRDFFGLNEGG